VSLDERIREIVEQTVREQGLDLEVRDPVAVHQIAALILAVSPAGEGGGGGGRAPAA
jgi:hypothetical protein